jgi:hypothetical protein
MRVYTQRDLRVDAILAPPTPPVLDLDQLRRARIGLRFRHVFQVSRPEASPMRIPLTFLPLLATLALALAATASAQEHAHGHDAASAAATTAPAQRWETDGSLREGMGRIRAAVDALQHYEHGHIGPQQAIQLADGIQRDVAFVVKNCTLEPGADAALHPILGALAQGAQALKTKPTELAAIAPMRNALQDYTRQFDDPGLSAQEPEESR